MYKRWIITWAAQCLGLSFSMPSSSPSSSSSGSCLPGGGVSVRTGKMPCTIGLSSFCFNRVYNVENVCGERNFLPIKQSSWTTIYYISLRLKLCFIKCQWWPRQDWATHYRLRGSDHFTAADEDFTLLFSFIRKAIHDRAFTRRELLIERSVPTWEKHWYWTNVEICHRCQKKMRTFITLGSHLQAEAGNVTNVRAQDGHLALHELIQHLHRLAGLVLCRDEQKPWRQKLWFAHSLKKWTTNRQIKQFLIDLPHQPERDVSEPPSDSGGLNASDSARQRNDNHGSYGVSCKNDI